MNKTSKSYASASVKKLDRSQVEITGSVPAETWEQFRAAALTNINNTVTIDGFRKGNIPENILIAKVGEMVILEEMAELALPKAYMEILIDQKIDAIGRPEISVTKLARGNDLEFKAVTAVVPEIKLPDYKKLAAEQVKKAGQPDTSVSDKEVDDAEERIKKMLNPPTIPRKQLSAMLSEDKKTAAREKLRLSIADAIAAETIVELPNVMIESELNRTQSQFENDIQRMGAKLDDYLKHAKKTLEEVRKEWLPHAEKKAKLQLILNEISRLENIKPSLAEIEAETDHIVEHYKDADRERAAIYAETVLTNEKVFEFLEAGKEEPKKN